MNRGGSDQELKDNADVLPPGVVRQLGTDTWSLLVFDDGSARGWWDWSQPPLRKPVWFDRTADGGLVPRDRGARRKRILNEVGWILDQVGPFHPAHPDVFEDGEFVGSRGGHRLGRPPGNGLDRALTRRTMVRVRADNPGMSASDCYGLVRDELTIAYDTVLDHLYKRDPEGPEPVCAPRPVIPMLPWERDWASWETDLSARLEWLRDEVSRKKDGELRHVEAGLAQLEADLQEFRAARAHAALSQVIHNARLVACTIDTFVEQGCSRADVKYSLSLLACDSNEIDDIYKLGRACDATDPDAPLYVPPHWFDKVRQYLPSDSSR